MKKVLFLLSFSLLWISCADQMDEELLLNPKSKDIEKVSDNQQESDLKSSYWYDFIWKGEWEGEISNILFNTYTDEQLGCYHLIVMFKAKWSGHCNVMKPYYYGSYDEHKSTPGDVSTVKYVMIDIEDYPEIASKEGIISVPTLKLYRRGECIATSTTDRDTRHINSFIKCNFEKYYNMPPKSLK